MNEYGMGGIEIRKFSPAVDIACRRWRTCPNTFRERFFGGLDYAIIGRKL